MTETEAALTATFKAGKDFDAPWLVVRANDPGQLVQYIDGIQQAGLAAVVANAAKDFQGVYNVGKGLAAVPAQAPAAAPPAAPAPQQQQPQQPGPAQGGFPPAPAWGAAPAQQQPQAPAAPAQQQPAAQGWGAPAAAPAAPAEGPWIPGLGMAAKVKTGNAKSGPNVGQPYTRYEDPRGWAQIKDLQKTKEINDPGIAAGTHRYEAYAN